MKKILCLTVALLVGTSVLAGSYIDKQLKEAKKNVKHNSVKTQLEDSSYADLYIQKQDIKNLKRSVKGPSINGEYIEGNIPGINKSINI